MVIPRRTVPLWVAAVCLLAACEDRTSVRTEGDWQIDRVRVHGPEQSFAHFELRYRTKIVDRDISLEPENLRFFPPDCVVYRPNRQGPPFYAACGDRQPALLPAWVSVVTAQVVAGGPVIRDGRTKYEVADIAHVLDAARRQPRRAADWDRQPHAPVDVPSRLVDSPPGR